MKTLILMRHAKSSWKYPDLPDRERPLNARGEKDAARAGKHMREGGYNPQVIYSSSAVRCAKTAEMAAEKLGYTNEVIYQDALYLAEPSYYLELLRGLSDDVDTILMVGHNPGLEGLVQILTHELESMPTAAVAVVSLPVRAWAMLDVRIDCGLESVWKPKH